MKNINIKYVNVVNVVCDIDEDYIVEMFKNYNIKQITNMTKVDRDGLIHNPYNIYVENAINIRVLYLDKTYQLRAILWVFDKEKYKHIDKVQPRKLKEGVERCNKLMGVGNTLKELVDKCYEQFSLEDRENIVRHFKSFTNVGSKLFEEFSYNVDHRNIDFILNGICRVERRGDDFFVYHSLSACRLSYNELLSILKHNHKYMFKHVRKDFDEYLDSKPKYSSLPKSLFKPSHCVITKDKCISIHYTCKIQSEEI